MSYEKSLAKALLNKGRLAGEKSFWGGFDDLPRRVYQHVGVEGSYYRLDNKLPKCGKWTTLTDVKEEYASEFTDTFSDPAEVCFVSSKLSCECGEIDGEGLFYIGTVSELLGEVLKSDNLLEY